VCVCDVQSALCVFVWVCDIHCQLGLGLWLGLLELGLGLGEAQIRAPALSDQEAHETPHYEAPPL
jgi:hypothetical protein